MVGKKRVELSDVLMRQGIISKDDLEKAERYREKHGGSLSEVLVKLELVEEDQVVIGLAEQLGIPTFSISSSESSKRVRTTSSLGRQRLKPASGEDFHPVLNSFHD